MLSRWVSVRFFVVSSSLSFWILLGAGEANADDVGWNCYLSLVNSQSGEAAVEKLAVE